MFWRLNASCHWAFDENLKKIKLYYDFHYISLYTPQKVLNYNAITLDLSQAQEGLNSEVSSQFWLWSFSRLQARSFPEVLSLHSFSQTSWRPIIVDFFFFFFIDFFQSLSCGFFFQKPWHSKRSSHGLLKTFLFPPTSFFHCLSVFPSCLECHRGTQAIRNLKENFLHLIQMQSSRRGHGESVGKITWTGDWRTGKNEHNLPYLCSGRN